VTPPESRDYSAIDVAQRERNADFDWDAFDSTAYFDHNYGTLRDDDKQIIDIVAEFFQTREIPRLRSRAIDVGAGANLYPALTLLPFAAELVLYERAFTNRQWLTAQLAQPSTSWSSFWSHIKGERRAYQPVKDPLSLLGRRARVVKGNIFSLRPGQFDIGTMFFVAESITARRAEFRDATTRFVRSLVTGAPFAAAFMRQSSGYSVGDGFFPACAIDENDVRTVLSDVADIADIHVVESESLRPGYSGMIVATGFTNRR
jgi:hypothetical protein